MADAVNMHKVYAAIDEARPELERVLGDLVRAPSVTGAEEPVQDVVEREFRARGYDVDRWIPDVDELKPYAMEVGEFESMAGRPNVVGLLPGGGGGKSILLNAHVDVVDPGDHDRWEHGPWSGDVVGDILHGRGSLDMKGGLATYLIALDALHLSGIKLAGDVTLATTVGEENGGVGAVATMLRGYRADAAIITEPTDLDLIIASEGSMIFRLQIDGRSAHAAKRDDGVSAIEKFIPIFQDLQAFEDERNAMLDHPLYAEHRNKVPINVGVIQSGVWASTVPETLVAQVRAGFLPGEELETFWAQMQARIHAAAQRDDWLREHPPQLERFDGQFSATEIAPDDPLSVAVLAAHKQVTGNDAAVLGATYGADQRHFINLGGMPTLMYGAGDVKFAHQDNESIDLRDIETAAKVLATFLVDWCGTA